MKSTIANILEVQRLIGKLDKRGKLAILRDLQKQNLFQKEAVKEDEESPNEAQKSKHEKEGRRDE